MQLATAVAALTTITLAATPLAARGCDDEPPNRGVRTSPGEIGDGQWLVPEDLAAGTYKTYGSQSCFWKRLALDRGSDDTRVLQRGRGLNQRVTLLATDHAFQTTGCGSWKRVP